MSEEEPVSRQRTELLSHILDDDTLAYTEEKFASVVRIRISRRTRAVIELKFPGSGKELMLYYHLPNEKTRDCTLQVESSAYRYLAREHPDLLELAKHRACEAILGVRNGHKEYTRVTKRKKQMQADIP